MVASLCACTARAWKGHAVGVPCKGAHAVATVSHHCWQADALAAAAAAPNTVDAVVVFEDGGAAGPGARYTIRANHTGLPSTRVVYNAFDILPDSQYRDYWFFANLQLALDRRAAPGCSLMVARKNSFLACVDVHDSTPGDGHGAVLARRSSSFAACHLPAVCTEHSTCGAWVRHLNPALHVQGGPGARARRRRTPSACGRAGAASL